MSELVEKKRSALNWQLALKIAVTLAILGVIVAKYNWPKMWNELRNAEPRWIAYAFISIGIGYFCSAVRWRYLLQVQHVRLTLGKTWVMTMIGIFFNQCMPASTGGDVIKIFYILKQAPDRKARAALSIGMDRILGLIAILTVTLLLVPFEFRRLFDNPETRLFIIILASILTLVFLGLAFLWLAPLHRLPAFVHRLWEKMPKRDVFESLYEGYHAHRLAIRPSLMAVLSAALAVFPILTTGYLIAQSLHLDASYAQITILFAMVLCSISLPISFGGHGVREAAFVLLFKVFDMTRNGLPVSDETALACSTLFLLLGVAWSLIGGVIYLCYSHALKAHDS
ncbi:MAG: lysylphosphatidylglycerol synthase transmembrane domain-containing protein [Methylacidiphilales bacterium]|nr:lysylphosphatidylglycerol synthase transmembrane domain-containing protein [Candidatus Methylacidiphilales bacterium]